jgi:hypothetical protein
MKSKKFIGSIIILCASFFTYDCAIVCNFDFVLAVVLATILDIIGLYLLNSGMTDRIELVPERRYKLINYLEKSLEGGLLTYTTFKYHDVYGIERVHTFKNVKFLNYASSTDYSPGYEPREGNVYAAYVDKTSGEIFLKYRIEE